MMDEYKLDEIVREIRNLKKSATELKRISGDIEAVRRNTDRILASIKMLEINITDVADFI